ncbi:hypothetical protein EYR40_007929 [Pleurotus pulmonarius]|nr:hypothetical protein EYR38_007762 [Pleurotus pulmonarius]KAF4597470.1 hypothetical protein EYR40_007929 [Pleurotus pulmonarius]
MDRIQHLDIFERADSNSTALAKIMETIAIAAKGSANVLQSFHLYKNLSRQSISDSDTVYESIHRVFDTVQMPCLQSLEVEGFTLPPTIPIFSQLRRLSYAPPHHVETSVSSITSILRETPALKRLTINGPLVTSQEVIERSTAVELPELTNLTYITSEFKGSSLFRQLRYPPSVRVTFMSRHGAPIASCFDDVKAVPLRMASNDDIANIDFIQICDENIAFRVHVSDCHGQVLLGLRLELVSESVLPLLEISLMLPRSPAHTFHISGCHLFRKRGWEELFRRHEHVQKLVIEGLNPSCIRALFKSPEAEQPCFAQLKTLCLKVFDTELNGLLVVQVLEERKRLGSPINLLEVWGYGYGVTDAIEVICQVEGYVKVDGHLSWTFHLVAGDEDG